MKLKSNVVILSFVILFQVVFSAEDAPIEGKQNCNLNETKRKDFFF